MSPVNFNTSLTKIVNFWENISKERSDDPDAYDYIVSQSISLKMTAFQLKDSIEFEILKDKRTRLKLQKLQKALEHIDNKLDFKIQVKKDKDYIQKILNKLSKIKKDVNVIKQYQ